MFLNCVSDGKWSMAENLFSNSRAQEEMTMTFISYHNIQLSSKPISVASVDITS